jgi:eukaryotic-like serine/threonine-protein kinase
MGSEGWQVKRLQKLLRQQGLLPEPAKIDGDFGEITEAAVKTFQELHDLTPDGIVGPMTWRALVTADVAAPVSDTALQPA